MESTPCELEIPQEWRFCRISYPGRGSITWDKDGNPEEVLYNDPMDDIKFDESTAFPLVKPNIEIFDLSPRTLRRWRGWYQVKRWPPARSSSCSLDSPRPTGADIPEELFDNIMRNFAYKAYRTLYPAAGNTLGVLSKDFISQVKLQATNRQLGCIALTCRRWAKFVQPRIFSDIVLRNRDDVDTLLSFLRRPQTRIAASIDVLRLSLSVETQYPYYPWVHTVCLAVLPRLHTVPRISLEVRGPLPPKKIMRGLHDMLPKRSPQFFSHIKTLVLADLHFKSYAHILRALAEMPAVRDITLKKLTWDDSLNAQKDLVPRYRARFDRSPVVNIMQCTDNALSAWIAALLRPRTKEDWLDRTDTDRLCRIASATLKDVKWSKYPDHYALAKDVDHADPRNRLETTGYFYLNVKPDRGPFTHLTPDLVVYFTSEIPDQFRRIRVIGLDFWHVQHVSKAVQACDWAAFDTLATTLPALHVVLVILDFRQDVSPTQFFRTVVKKMPHLSQSGKLRCMYHHGGKEWEKLAYVNGYVTAMVFGFYVIAQAPITLGRTTSTGWIPLSGQKSDLRSSNARQPMLAILRRLAHRNYITRKASIMSIQPQELLKGVPWFLDQASQQIFNSGATNKEGLRRRLKQIIEAGVKSGVVELPKIQELCTMLQFNAQFVKIYAALWLPKTQRLELSPDFEQSGLFKFTIPCTVSSTSCAVIGSSSITGDALMARSRSFLKGVLLNEEWWYAITTLPEADARHMHQFLQELVLRDLVWCQFIAENPPNSPIKTSSEMYRSRVADLYAELSLHYRYWDRRDMLRDLTEYDPQSPAFHRNPIAVTRQAKYQGKRALVKQLLIRRRGVFSESKSLAVANGLYKRAMSEMLCWRRLKHKNVVPLLDLMHDSSEKDGPQVLYVIPLMKNGNIVQYIRGLCAAGRTPRPQDFGHWLAAITDGLWYLHEEGIVHGNLHGSQILVDDYGLVRLADFGMAPLVILKRELTETVNTGQEDVMCRGDRWMPPELLREVPGYSLRDTRAMWNLTLRSPAVDSYAFASTVVEIYSLSEPVFNEKERPSRTPTWQVREWIRNGHRPLRPRDNRGRYLIPDALWGLMQDCWRDDPVVRPTMQAIHCLVRAAFQR
ncbi:hypothetical protein NM688_g6590 [Phlebia brevispora]|uniref:Uncharacterized protein n=1 Tax=Phlebia brevispora TaxID=194682 RepID=A0ACC1SEP3_9APHY|nr:hypothetical protein NM688_g6590 [Phlebia brevispora]